MRLATHTGQASISRLLSSPLASFQNALRHAQAPASGALIRPPIAHRPTPGPRARGLWREREAGHGLHYVNEVESEST